MKNKILIVGHIRSGHHFLADSIGLNSNKFSGFVWLNIDSPTLRKTQAGIIYKNHGYYNWHKNYINTIKENFHVFVPVRDGRDVLVSTYHFKKKHTRHTIPQDMSFQEFLRFEDCTYIKHWVQHVNSWIRPFIYFIRYRDLHDDFKRIMKQVLEILGEKKERFRKPKFGEYYSACNIQRKGIVGDYKNYFTQEDLKLFDSIAGNTMKLFGFK